MLLKKLHKLYDIICCIIVLLFSALLILTMLHSDCHRLCDGGSGRYRFSDLGEKVLQRCRPKQQKEYKGWRLMPEAENEGFI